jgi:ADP-heptose:LPS heptosyltransferase
MPFWLRVNRRLYAAYYRWRHRTPLAAALPRASARGEEILFLAWGRIGDTVLSTGILKHFRGAFGRRIVAAGRPEVAPIVQPHVDEFVPFGADLAARVTRPYAAVVTDVHFFYGGAHALHGLLAGLPAERRIMYEGYHLGPGLAPVRVVPPGVEVVAALAKAAPRWHILLDNEHYFREVTRRLAGEAHAGADYRPALEAPPADGLLRRHGLAAGEYVAWQTASNNRKKDYPADRWRAVLARFPDVRFVALGAPGEPLGVPHAVDLRGKTDLREAMALIGAARAFLGPDSGLTHIAACLGRPTVCVAQNSNLGYFFPYPEEYGYGNLATVDHPAYRECARCFMTCAREPILLTYLKGAKCLRELPPELVAVALNGKLAPAPVAATA